MHNPAFPRAPQHLLRVVACWCGCVLRRELRGQCVVNCVVRTKKLPSTIFAIQITFKDPMLGLCKDMNSCIKTQNSNLVAPIY